MALKAHVILEAVRLSINAEPAQLQEFIAQQPTLKLETLLRILLTYLPETLEPQKYYDLLVHLSGEGTDRPTPAVPSTESSFYNDQLSNAKARDQVRHLRLLPLVRTRDSGFEPDLIDADPFTQFLIHRAHRIETETGSLPLVSELVEPFLGRSDYLRLWAISNLLPLLRLDYEYYASEKPTYSLEAFENLSGHLAVPVLLSKATVNKNGGSQKGIGQDLRGLVGPWAYGQIIGKRRKLEGVARRRSSVASTTYAEQGFTELRGGRTRAWDHVNDWLLDLSLRDYPQAVEAFVQWGGPRDVDYGGWGEHTQQTEENTIRDGTNRYAQTGLAIIYAHPTASPGVIEASHRVLKKVRSLVDLASIPDLGTPDVTLAQGISVDYLESLSPNQLLHDALLRPQNPLTVPTEHSLFFAHILLLSNHILNSFGQSISCRNLVDLAIFGNESDQLAELRRVLHTLSARSDNWRSNRYKILWLRNWNHHANPHVVEISGNRSGIYSKIELSVVENEILKAMLAGTNYDNAVEIYCKQDNGPLPLATVEKTVIDAALASYDSASNGNRTRGGVRKASEMWVTIYSVRSDEWRKLTELRLSAFRTFFPDSEAFHKTSALLKATHGMSFYSLTLERAVPFQPVNIRAHKDPMLLLGKILEQNPRSYTKLDDLLDIGQDLVAAGFSATVADSGSKRSTAEAPEQSLLAKRRVTGMAIEAALREDDFDTAYSYIVNRLPAIARMYSNENPDSNDDVSWRAAYKAGCYKPTKHSGPSIFRRLEQRLELLSQALLLAPPSALTDILEVWHHCEDDLNVALAQEAEAEENWDDRGDRRIPGGYTADSPPRIQKPREPSRAAMNEEAPMGLFDVARGAAATFSKSAFPLRSARNSAGAGSLQTVHERSLSKMSGGGSDSGSGTDAEGRVRKRDVVSNMVTGGLASGIGWVLGAPPVRGSEHE